MTSCSRCGGDNPDGVAFCRSCGLPISGASASAGDPQAGSVPLTTSGAPRRRYLVPAAIGIMAVIAGVVVARIIAGPDDSPDPVPLATTANVATTMASVVDSALTTTDDVAASVDLSTLDWTVSCQTTLDLDLSSCVSEHRPATRITSGRPPVWAARADWYGVNSRGSFQAACDIRGGTRDEAGVIYRFRTMLDLSRVGRDVTLTLGWAADNHLTSVALGGVSADIPEESDPYASLHRTELRFAGVGGSSSVALEVTVTGDGCTDGLMLAALDLA